MLTVLDKKGIEEKAGKRSLLDHQYLSGKLEYISGVKEVDEILERKNTKALVVISKRKNGIEISVVIGLKTYSTAISDEKIIGVYLEDKDKIIEMKDKSIVGRALLGGFLFGSTGAIVGGMTGINPEQKVIASPDMFLTIKFINDYDEEDYFICSCTQKNKAAAIKFLSSTLKRKFNLGSLPTENIKVNVNANANVKEDIPELIKKLAELKDQGILTDDEFNTKKTELLSKI